MHAFAFGPRPQRAEVRSEIDEINELQRDSVFTPELKVILHDTVLDEIDSLPDVPTQSKFRVAVEAGLQAISLAKYESPADADARFGQVAADREDITRLPELPNYKRQPAQPKFD